jgi:hypothetical protein
MLNGDILHPLDVGDIIDVSVLVNDGLGDNDGFGVRGSDGHGAILSMNSWICIVSLISFAKETFCHRWRLSCIRQTKGFPMKRALVSVLLLSVILSACAAKATPAAVQMVPEVSTTLPDNTVPPAAGSEGGGSTGQVSLPATITMSDNGKTFTAKVGDSFLLNLGDDVYNWEVTIDRQDVVTLKKGVMVIKGAQGIYDALAPGTATLTAVGDPLCRQSAPPCGMPSILFKITLIVE